MSNKSTRSVIYRLIFVACVSLSPSVTLAQVAQPTSYERAVEARKKGDCKETIAHLEKYKAESEAVLKLNPEFAKNIELQIASCLNLIAHRERRTRIVAYDDPFEREEKREILRMEKFLPFVRANAR